MAMDKYFETLNATMFHVKHWPPNARDKALRKALTLNHGAKSEAKYIIRIWKSTELNDIGKTK
jgi:hypothetical protein